LFAKDKKHVAIFQDLFINNQIQKSYHGIVRGFPPTNLNINSDVKGRDSDIYKTAFTHLKTLKTKEMPIAVYPYKCSRYSLVELSPKTGRLHQLRIHMNKINHPLIGDPKYGDRFHNRMFIKEFDCDKLFLHASIIEFVHPFSKKKIYIKAAFPNDWGEIFKEFEW
jgi:tRNA pseudouridine65 synthase